VLHSAGLLAPVHDYVDALVHPSARRDALTAARHRAFIAPRLLGGLIALAAFPLLVAMRGAPSALEAMVLAWLIVPVLVACFLSRTGRLEAAHILSSLALTVLVTMVAAASGGIASFAAVWLVLVPLDAALSASRRAVVAAALFALAAAAFLMLLATAGLTALPSINAEAARGLSALAVGAASLYATALALGAESMARTGIRLRSAEDARYRLLARNMTDVIARHGRGCAVLFISPAAETLFGAAPHQLRGHGLLDRVHVGDRPAFLTALSDAAAERATRSVEFRVRRDAAAVRCEPHFVWVEMRCRPLAQEAGETAEAGDRQVVSVMRDVSERKAQEAKIEAARGEADRANAAKSRFLATMSHELRTPLNAIIGFSDMLVNEEAMHLDGSRRRDYARTINESGHHLLAVVNGILDMSKIEAGNFAVTPEPFGLAAVAEGCCDLMALRAREAGVDLVMRLPRDLPEVFADRRAVKQILLNLLANAVKFTDGGGRVTASAAAEDGCVALSIADTGIGIGADDLARLGDPFFQAHSDYDRPRDGAGLGLSIVKGLLDRQDGRMEIASRVGEGTCVTVRLPAVGAVRRIGDDAGASGRAGVAAATSNIRVKKRA
jgi:cell cycle sensor histidine kinase DivJ